MTPITLYRFTYTPLGKSPIRSIDVFIEAESRKEAELIALDHSYRFFDQDNTVKVEKILEGFKEFSGSDWQQ